MKQAIFLVLVFLVSIALCGYHVFPRLPETIPNKEIKKISSALEQTDLLSFCDDAVCSEKQFVNFKRAPVFNLFFETFTFEEGMKLLQILETKHAWILEKIDLIKEIDGIGNPRVYDYPRIGKISPSTLYYAKIAAELKELFGDLHPMRITEIGTGSSGLCAVLIKLFDVHSYTIIDHMSFLQLAQKCLGKLGIHEKVRFVNYAQLQPERSDLVISLQSFAESGRIIQASLFNNTIKTAKRGFLLYGTAPAYYGISTYSKESIISMMKRSMIQVDLLEEVPQTRRDNSVLVWGQN